MYEKNARSKLTEAKFFFSKMLEEQNNQETFNFYLSAFLSSSRSIVQYAYEEVKNDSLQLNWHNDYVSKHAPLGFFKGRRDINIHISPVEPSLTVAVELHERSVAILESVNVVVKDKDGVISNRTFEEHRPKEPTQEEKPKVSYTYKFVEWTGKEDVVKLCESYLKELEIFINEMRTRGF